MTKEAFAFALQQVRPPEGKVLWLGGPTLLISGQVYTPYKYKAVELTERGVAVTSEIEKLDAEYDAIFIDCPKSMDETEGTIAWALAHSRGFVMAAAGNEAGGSRLKNLFTKFGVAVGQESKHHCKVVWTTEAPKADRTATAKAMEHIQPRQMELDGRQYWTVPGLFGWNKIDEGSRMLAEHLPATLAGKAADFGCGYGYLTKELLARCSNISQVDAYDNDQRAVAATQKNNSDKVKAIWADLRVHVSVPVYDVVVMNPPFHAGKDTDIGLGETFIKKAFTSLRPGGQLFMVANHMLPYEGVVPGLRRIVEDSRFKILTVKRA